MLKRIQKWRATRRIKKLSSKSLKSLKKETWRINNPLEFILFIARKIWFWVVFINLFDFVQEKWEECVDFSQLSGYNLLFVVFIIMLMLPLLAGFKLSFLGSGMEATVKPDSSTAILEKIKTEVKIDGVSTKPAEDLSKNLEDMMRPLQDEIGSHEKNGGESK